MVDKLVIESFYRHKYIPVSQMCSVERGFDGLYLLEMFHSHLIIQYLHVWCISLASCLTGWIHYWSAWLGEMRATSLWFSSRSSDLVFCVVFFFFLNNKLEWCEQHLISFKQSFSLKYSLETSWVKLIQIIFRLVIGSHIFMWKLSNSKIICGHWNETEAQVGFK